MNHFNYKYKNIDGVYEVEIPFLRLDINGPHDMVEEIGRIYGYDKVTPILPKINFEIKENKTWNNINSAKNYLINLDYIIRPISCPLTYSKLLRRHLYRIRLVKALNELNLCLITVK